MGASIATMNNCSCKAAATRAYRELRQRGVPDRSAFEAAVNVYRCYHPESAGNEARRVVCDWIADEIGQ